MNEQDRLEQKIRQTLDRQQLSDDSRNALRKARMTALDSRSGQSVLSWKPAAAFASLVLIIAGVLVLGVQNEAEFPQADVEDLAVISSEDEFEFYQELEFYVWFDEDQDV